MKSKRKKDERLGKIAKKEKGYMINTQVKIDGKWKHFQKSGYNTMDEALADYDRALKEFIKKKSKNIKVSSFDDLVEDFLTSLESKYSSNTIKSKSYIIRTYLNHFNGSDVNDAFEQSNIKVWYRNLIDMDISCELKNRSIGNLSDLTTYAFKHKHITSEMFQDTISILDKVKNKDIKKEREMWSDDDLSKFKKYIKTLDFRDFCMFSLFLSLGARCGEFLAISVDSLDFDNQTVTIDKQYSNAAIGKEVTHTLKTKNSYRVVPVSDDVMSMLKLYIKDFNLKNKDMLWFSNHSRKTPISQVTFHKKLQDACDEANVPRLNPHAIRHIIATKLASVCKTTDEIEAAAHILGHTPSMFMNTYANHNNINKQNELLKKIGLK